VKLLEWLFVTELLFLFCAWVLWTAGRLVARVSPNDTIYQFATVFWSTFRHRPAPLREVVPDDDEGGEMEGDPDALLKGFVEEEQPGGAGGAPASAAGIRMATLSIKVIPHASRDKVCGFLGKDLKIQVTAPAEAGAANKAVIDLLATTLGLKSHQIQLIRGHYQEQKVLQIAGMRQDEVESRLSSFE
jgi:uncharacterized protein (TIGR00251 family)